MYRWVARALGLTGVLVGVSAGAQPEHEGLQLRVVDTAQALCVVAVIPGNHYVIYDAGTAGACFAGIRELVPEGARVELMVLSHADADHLGAVPKITAAYDVRRVLRTGFARDTRTWCEADVAIAREVQEGAYGPTGYAQALEHCLEHGAPAPWMYLPPVNGRRDINLAHTDFQPGGTYRFGDAFLTFVTGHHAPPEAYGALDGAEARNAVSIMVKLRYGDRSVLLTGDAVGRHEDQEEDACIATEAEAIEIAETWSVLSLDADVLVAPHHGADNGSCGGFIRAVSPQWVVVSAGRRYQHPDADAMKRYLAAGVPADRILRTDRGDDEGGEEWDHLRVEGCEDRGRDDAVDIRIGADGAVTVAYVEPHHPESPACRQ